jgi:inosose dehydratase
MTIHLASAPVSFGVFELTAGRDDLPAGPLLAKTIAELGYSGSELGPPGYFGDGAEVAKTLGDEGLVLMGSFLPLRFSRAEHIAEDMRGLEDNLSLLDEARGDGPKPMVLLCDSFSEPDRMALAGRIEQHPETWLDDDRFALLVENAVKAADRCRERGFPVSFHYHAGTYVESPREIERFIDGLGDAQFGIVFDTGHSAFGGGNPLELLRAHGDLVNHVHLKDVDLVLLRRLHAEGAGLETAWEEGMFCRLGEGGADVEGCLAELKRREYDGWLVVEQDQVIRPGRSFEDTVESARANREWLRQRGL